MEIEIVLSGGRSFLPSDVKLAILFSSGATKTNAGRLPIQRRQVSRLEITLANGEVLRELAEADRVANQLRCYSVDVEMNAGIKENSK